MNTATYDPGALAIYRRGFPRQEAIPSRASASSSMSFRQVGLNSTDPDTTSTGGTSHSVAPLVFESAGVSMVGDLYAPASDSIAAVVVCGAWTAVKEQATGLYARRLAERGYAALAFDHRYFGESGGEPRQFEAPRFKVEDIRSAVTALLADSRTGELPVLGLGVCAGGGYMARAVAEDSRIQGFAGVAGAYNDVETTQSFMGAAYDQFVERGRAAEQRWRETRQAETIPAVGAEGGDVAMPFPEAFDYYGTSRGATPNYVNGFAVQSYAHVLPWDVIGAAPEINVPTLIVHSENATLPDLARRMLDEVAGPADQLWLTSENQVAFYDDPALILPATDAVAAHFGSVVS